MSSDSAVKLSKKKSLTRKGSGVKSDTDGSSLLREKRSAMDCQNILTGFYGPRGERIKHIVAKGALKMPLESLELIDRTSMDLEPSSTSYKLPGLDSVPRSMVDRKMGQVVITELTPERVNVAQQLPQPPPVPGQMPQPPQVTYVKQLRTRVENRVLTRTLAPASTAGEQPVEGERIRGGGDNNPPANVPPGSGQVPPVPGAAQASAQAPPQQQQQQQQQQPHPAVPMPAQPPAQAQPPVAPQQQAAYHPAPGTPVAPGAPQPIAPSSAPPQARPSHPPGQVPSAAPPQASPAPAPGQVPSTTTSSTTTVPPQTVSSATPPATTSGAPQALPTKTLNNKPRPQWNQHKPALNDETVTPDDQLTPNPDWYKTDKIADLERTMLPEWFDGSAPHRTPEKYLKTRERIIAISKTVLNRNVTNSMIRRSIEGDAGSLHRLRAFLINWGFINEDSINDSAPTPLMLRKTNKAPRKFDETLSDSLISAIVQESKKRKLEQGDGDDAAIDWDEVAKTVGQGVTGEDCERNFLSLGIETEAPAPAPEAPPSDAMAVDGAPAPAPAAPGTKPAAAPAATPKSEISKESLRQEFIRDLIDSSNPEMVKKVTNAALQACEEDVKKAQGAAVIGLITSRALENARAQEDILSSTLAQLVNKRMEKLENRMAMIDDIEGILEAEKVALELERRDLYTARCRHWYGDA